MDRRLSVTERRVVASVAICIVIVGYALLIGGVPLLVAIGTLTLATTVALPARARRHLWKRAMGVVISVGLAMWFMWLLAHNYPDRSRQDDPGVVPAFERYVDWIGDVVRNIVLELAPDRDEACAWHPIARTHERRFVICLQNTKRAAKIQI